LVTPSPLTSLLLLEVVLGVLMLALEVVLVDTAHLLAQVGAVHPQNRH
jgi:hypothetical protein